MRVEAPSSLGADYVAVGLGSQMKGSSVAVAWMESGVAAAMAATYRLTGYSAPADGSCGGGSCPLSMPAGARGGDGTLAVEVTIDDTTSQPTGLIFSRGGGWKSYHADRGLAAVNLVSGGITRVVSDTRELHKLHGVLMIAVWLGEGTWGFGGKWGESGGEVGGRGVGLWASFSRPKKLTPIPCGGGSFCSEFCVFALSLDAKNFVSSPPTKEEQFLIFFFSSEVYHTRPLFARSRPPRFARGATG